MKDQTPLAVGLIPTQTGDLSYTVVNCYPIDALNGFKSILDVQGFASFPSH